MASVLLASLVLPNVPAALAATAAVQGVRLWRSPDKTRLVFDLSGNAEHKLFPLNNPGRLVLDLQGVHLPGSLADLALGDTPIKKIRWAARNKNDLRVVLDLKDSITPRSFLLKPNDTYGYRLVIDLHDKASVAKPVVPQKPEAIRDIVVAIDAGHGGEDPGAVGHGGAKEKDIVLAIAKKLETLMVREKGFKPVLIRSGDYYISLRERTRLAREKNADVLVSIHADAFVRKSAHGASVYTLSKRGATSEAARWLANKENSSDLIGGEDGVSLDDKDDLLASVLLDLSMTDSQARSEKIGHQVLQHMGRFNKLHKSKVEQAAFVVLKSPDIPSILVETGFISNPAEARKLATKAHQSKLARSIHTGVRDFFLKNPPAGTLIAHNKDKRNNITKTYKVQRGDTLTSIASEHDISLNRLLSFNSIDRNDPLRVGQTLQIP